MKKRSINSEFDYGINTERVSTHKGGTTNVKARRFGSRVYINPPPDDNRCEICGRKADDLEPFDHTFCEHSEQFERMIYAFYPNSSCVTRYITPDHKLTKIFRSFYEDQVIASWECKDCISLPTAEAIERMKSSK